MVWVALEADWQDDSMFDGATPGARLAWVHLLCHVKVYGRGGTAKLRRATFAKRCDLSERAVDDMLAAAQKCGSIRYDGGTVTICKWRTYQVDRVRGKRDEVSAIPKTPESATTITITDTSTSTNTNTPRGVCISDGLPDDPAGDYASGVVALFDQMWAAIPQNRRKAKIAARNEFRDAVRNRCVAADDLTARLVEYYASDIGQTRYAKTVVTFIRDGCYEDDPSAWEGQGSGEQPANGVSASETDAQLDRISKGCVR